MMAHRPDDEWDPRPLATLRVICEVIATFVIVFAFLVALSAR